jgi:hypothetical protein
MTLWNCSSLLSHEKEPKILITRPDPLDRALSTGKMFMIASTELRILNTNSILNCMVVKSIRECRTGGSDPMQIIILIFPVCIGYMVLALRN